MEKKHRILFNIKWEILFFLSLNYRCINNNSSGKGQAKSQIARLIFVKSGI